MKDCKKHYTEMYKTRTGLAGCPWCELDSIKTTIRTFLHDLDSVPDDNKPGVLMSPFMWMQVEAFRKIVSNYKKIEALRRKAEERNNEQPITRLR